MMASALIEELRGMVAEYGDRPVVFEASDEDKDVVSVDEGTEYSDAGERPVFVLQ